MKGQYQNSGNRKELKFLQEDVALAIRSSKIAKVLNFFCFIGRQLIFFKRQLACLVESKQMSVFTFFSFLFLGYKQNIQFRKLWHGWWDQAIA